MLLSRSLTCTYGMAANLPGIMLWIHVRLWSFIQLMFIKTQLIFVVLGHTWTLYRKHALCHLSGSKSGGKIWLSLTNVLEAKTNIFAGVLELKKKRAISMSEMHICL